MTPRKRMRALVKKIIPDILIRALWHLPRAAFANVFFCFPARKLTCSAIAGTKGKTSTAFFLAHFLHGAGYNTALFSTATVRDGMRDELNVWKMTTPDAWSVQSFLRRAIRNGCTHAVLEVSSHALKQYRVWGVPFTLVVITSLTPDHLDYHASAEEYTRVHEKLFSNRTRSFCYSDWQNSKFEIRNSKQITMLKIQNFGLDPRRSLSRVPPWDEDDKSVWWFPLQQANINAALCAARALGCQEEALARALKTLPCPPGRFEGIDEGQAFRVIVDYAHSPESLEYFLSQVRPLVKGNLIVVFGACGDRDKTARPVMGAILERYADRIILTTDDPYSEDPADIADQVARGFIRQSPEKRDPSPTSRDDRTLILDRKEAIRHALSETTPNDCVCILGKGAEQWQIFRGHKIAWDDRTIARRILRSIP